jgi:indolepyruvate ferredoxin oxidoreductase beta subunit
VIRLGIERLTDYQDAAYARDYLRRLAPIARLERSARRGSGALLEETARELALGMAYEDTIRVAALKTRPERFGRVRAEAEAGPDTIVEIAEFLHPRLEEIADTLPARLGRRLLRPGLANRLVRRLTRSGRVVHSSRVGGFLLLRAVAWMRRFRRGSLRFQAEQQFLDAWLATIAELAPSNYALAVEVARCRTVVKGYGDTHAHGRQKFDALMQALPGIAHAPGAAERLAAWRKAALADESGEALAKAMAEAPPAAQAAE